MKRAILLLAFLVAACSADRASGPSGADPGNGTGRDTTAASDPGSNPGSDPGAAQPRFAPGTYGFRLTLFPGVGGRTSSTSYTTTVVLAFPSRDSLTMKLTQFGLPFETQSFGGAWNGEAFVVRMRRSDTAGTVTALVRPPATANLVGPPLCEAQYSGAEGHAQCEFTAP
ncbi:MAG: hypothetical protein IRZ00_05845 [Gemmatimonadetes bacterium]|nr:hypothetical protein [Gemmatimonadota bacterium]